MEANRAYLMEVAQLAEDAESNYVIAVMLLISTNYKADCSRHAPATAQAGKPGGQRPRVRPLSASCQAAFFLPNHVEL